MSQEAIVLGSVLFAAGIFVELPNDMKLKRKAIRGVIKSKVPSRSVKPLSLNDCLDRQKNIEIIEHFFTVLHKNFSHCDLSSFYKNVRSMMYIERDKNLLDKLDDIINGSTAGAYLPNLNITKIYRDAHDNDVATDLTRTHELLHMASSKKGLFSTECGYSKNIMGMKIGKGINEGYTEYLNIEYFSKDPFETGGYLPLQTIVAGIEKMVGEEKMQQMYFSNDLEGLVYAMTQYGLSEDLALSIITRTDKLYKIHSKGNNQELEEKLGFEIRTDIATAIIQKKKQELEQGKITLEQFKKEVVIRNLYTQGLFVYGEEDRETNTVTKVHIIRGPHFITDRIIQTDDPEKAEQEIMEAYNEMQKKLEEIYKYNTPSENKYRYDSEKQQEIERMLSEEKNKQTNLNNSKKTA